MCVYYHYGYHFGYHLSLFDRMPSDEDLKLLRRYIPAAVLPHLAVNQQLWSGELRQVTVLFLNLGIDSTKLTNIDQETVNEIQTVVRAVQGAVYEYEGSLNKFLIDDKGASNQQ